MSGLDTKKGVQNHPVGIARHTLKDAQKADPAKRAKTALKAGKFKKARAYYEEVAAADPTNRDAAQARVVRAARAAKAFFFMGFSLFGTPAL